MIKFLKLAAFAVAMSPAVAFAAPIRLDLAVDQPVGQTEKTVADANGTDVTVSAGGQVLGYTYGDGTGLWGMGVAGMVGGVVNNKVKPGQSLQFTFENAITDLIVEFSALAPGSNSTDPLKPPMLIDYHTTNDEGEYQYRRISGATIVEGGVNPDRLIHEITFSGPITNFVMFNAYDPTKKAAGFAVSALHYSPFSASAPSEEVTEDLPAIAPVPVPAAGLLLGGGVLLMGWLGRRKRRLANL